MKFLHSTSGICRQNGLELLLPRRRTFDGFLRFPFSQERLATGETCRDSLQLTAYRDKVLDTPAPQSIIVVGLQNHQPKNSGDLLGLENYTSIDPKQQQSTFHHVSTMVFIDHNNGYLP